MLPETFRAFRIHQSVTGVQARLESLRVDDLTSGDVVVRVAYSTINYKDALAATGKGKILRRPVLVGGIDLAGEVVASSNAAVAVGEQVVVTGCGLGETHDGGYAHYARVEAAAIVPIPAGLDAFTCMAIGTAGFTAALAIDRMEANGLDPDAGPIIVSGASGGVGSLAIDMLSARGYECVAISGKPHSGDYLRALGAHSILARHELEMGAKPLQEARWGGAIDNVGGELLGWLTRTMRFGASIASVGMAASTELKTTVLPFILRGINLLGINSVYTPRTQRLAVWRRLASDLKPRHLDQIVTRVITLEGLPGAFEQYVRGENVGRTVVKIGAE